MLEKYFLRRPVPADLQAVFDLEVRCDIRDVGFPDSDLPDLKADWSRIDLRRDAWLAFNGRGELKGYAIVLPWFERGCRLAIYDDPGTEETDLFLGLLVMAENRAAAFLRERDSLPDPAIFTHIADGNSHQKSVLEEAGYTIGKNIFTMHMDLHQPLPRAPLPAGVRVRTAVRGQDERALYALIQDAFDWRVQESQTFEGWKDLMLRPDIFDETLWFLAEKDGELIGSCLGALHPDIAWIRDLAVRKDFRRQGIGRALLQRAFDAFKARGYQKAGLSVEAGNPNAVDFYQKLGMVQAAHLDEYVKKFSSL